MSKVAQIEATQESQITQFLKEHGGVAVIDFYADWCGPCKRIAPYVHKKSQETGIPLIKVNVDNADVLSQAFKIQAMPTFKAISEKWNNVVGEQTGGSEQNVNTIFEAALKHKK